MPTHHHSYGKVSLRSLVLICSLLTALPLAHSQEWGLESRCGKHRGRPCQEGAFELSLGTTLLPQEVGEWNARPQTHLALFSRQRGPFKRGIRLGMVGLGSGVSEADELDGHSIRYRQFLPEFSGVIRFEPFRGGFRPFLEGEAGMSASILDESTFNAEGDRTHHNISEFQPGMLLGWGAGARFKMGKTALLILRYGERIGSPLDLIDQDAQDLNSTAQRQDVSLGMSFAF